MTCAYNITVSLLATGRREFVYFNSYKVHSVAVMTQEERDRYYREVDAVEDHSWISTSNDNFPETPANNYQFNRSSKLRGSLSLSSGVYEKISVSGTELQETYERRHYDDCDGNDAYYLGYTVIVNGVVVEGGYGFDVINRTHSYTTVNKTSVWEDGECHIETDTDSSSLTSNPSRLNAYVGSDYEDAVKLSSSSLKYNRKPNSSFAWSGDTTFTWTDWITYQAVLDDYAETIALVDAELEEEFSCSSSTATAIDGEIYGKCGAATLSGRTFLLSKYAVSFDDSYADKDHQVTGVDVQHLDDVDIVLLIAKSLGKPAQIRVVGEIVESSQDDPVVEAITPFDDILAVGAEDLSQSSSSHHAWKYGKPASWAAMLNAPAAGGSVIIRNLAVQIEQNGFFE